MTLLLAQSPCIFVAGRNERLFASPIVDCIVRTIIFFPRNGFSRQRFGPSKKYNTLEMARASDQFPRALVIVSRAEGQLFCITIVNGHANKRKRVKSDAPCMRDDYFSVKFPLPNSGRKFRIVRRDNRHAGQRKQERRSSHFCAKRIVQPETKECPEQTEREGRLTE